MTWAEHEARNDLLFTMSDNTHSNAPCGASLMRNSFLADGKRPATHVADRHNLEDQSTVAPVKGTVQKRRL
jgi:hypothetical protein